MTSLRAFTVLALCAVGLAGCGSDAGGSARADYIARADAICTPAQAAVGKLEAAKPTGMAEVIANFESAVATEKKMLVDLRALKAPAADAAALNAIYAQVDVQVVVAEKALAALKAGDVAGMQADLKDPVAVAAGKDTVAKARAFGLLVCGS
jgi:hypothetical protein